MMVDDIIYFSSNLKIKDIDFCDEKKLRGAFHDRLKECYLDPALKLNKMKAAFSAGVLLLSMIDALSRYIITDNDKVGARYKEFLRIYITSDSQVINSFYENFRNGLIHEARIKNCCIFSYDYSEDLFRKEDGILIVNPDALANKLKDILQIVDGELKNDMFLQQQFIERLKVDYEAEVENLKRIRF